MEQNSNLEWEHVTDPHTIFKLLKSQQVGWDKFTVNQIYLLHQTYGLEFDKIYNQKPKQYAEDSKIVSQSQIKDYINCQRLWYFRNIKHLKPEVIDETWLKFGKSMHLIVEKFYDNIDVDAAKLDAITHFSYVLKLMATQYWDYSLDKSLFEKDATLIMDDFAYVFGNRFNELAAQEKEDLFFPASTEEDIICTSYPLRAIIDRIDIGFESFVDYKTNKRFPELLLQNPNKLSKDFQLQYNILAEDLVIQAVICALCIKDKYGVFPHTCYFTYLRHLRAPHGGIISIPINQNVVDQVVAYVNNIYESMRSNTFKETEDKTQCIQYSGCEFTTACDAMSMCIMRV